MSAPLDLSFRDPSADGEVQFNPGSEAIDLAWGHPDPTLLPAAELAAATESVLSRRGWHALAYGYASGALSLREPLAAHLSATDAPTSPDQIVITGGSSGALDLLLGVVAQPGDVVFVERPTYFLALRMFADHAVSVVGLASDGEGPAPEDFAVQCAELNGRQGFLYLVSTYGNPTGRCLGTEQGRALVEIAACHGVIVIDDDVYRDTAVSSPPSLFGLASETGAEVVRFGSFSKVVAPGLRLGHLSASPELARRIAECGLLDSGGGANHFTAMVVGELMASGSYQRLVDEACNRFAERRSALVAGLDRSLLTFDEPHGGYFVWLTLPEGITSDAVVRAAASADVGVSDGDSFFPDQPPGRHIRLSFSLYGPETLVEGARRLNAAVRSLLG